MLYFFIFIANKNLSRVFLSITNVECHVALDLFLLTIKVNQESLKGFDDIEIKLEFLEGVSERYICWAFNVDQLLLTSQLNCDNHKIIILRESIVTPRTTFKTTD